jgi:predicted TIM-barrel fold metal-dependent hydrolase
MVAHEDSCDGGLLDDTKSEGAVTVAEPPATTALAADLLVEPWLRCLRDRLPQVGLFDCHTHLGEDPDGSRQTARELGDALDLIGARAVVFPLASSLGYRAANDRVLAAATNSAGRLVAFCRIDPRADGVGEAQRALAAGASGIKLHPRAERFALGDRELDAIFALAHEHRLPIIVHAGRGILSLGRDALARAARHPHAVIILAHAAITDLAWIWREAPAHPNLLFDTAWWNMADQLALFALVPPGQILFASDTPYGRPVAAAAVVLRAALASGLSTQQLASVAGGQIERLLAGQEPLALGGPPTAILPAPGPLLERLHTLLVAAIARMTTGQGADEYLDLARMACRIPGEHPDAATAASVLELLDRHAAHVASAPPQRGPRPPGIHLIFLAAAVARTPGLPLPTASELATSSPAAERAKSGDDER